MTATSLRNADPKKLLAAIRASNNHDALRPEEAEHVRNCTAILKETRELMPNDLNRLKHIASVICWD